MVHDSNSPKRAGPSKIEIGELALEVGEVQSGCDRAFSYTLIGAQQIHRQEIVPTHAVCGRRKKIRYPLGQLSRFFELRNRFSVIFHRSYVSRKDLKQGRLQRLSGSRSLRRIRGVGLFRSIARMPMLDQI